MHRMRDLSGEEIFLFVITLCYVAIIFGVDIWVTFYTVDLIKIHSVPFALASLFAILVGMGIGGFGELILKAQYSFYDSIENWVRNRCSQIILLVTLISIGGEIISFLSISDAIQMIVNI